MDEILDNDFKDLFNAIEEYAEAMGESYGSDLVDPNCTDDLLDTLYDDDSFSNSLYVCTSNDTQENYTEDCFIDSMETSTEEDRLDKQFPISPLWELPLPQRMSLPAPGGMTPGALQTRLIKELEFPEAFSMMNMLNRCNADLFSCMPLNGHLYENVKLLSQRPEDVIEAVEEIIRDDPRPHSTAVDLNAHGNLELPLVPETVEDLPEYVNAVQKFFAAELEARETNYAKLFFNYCAALVKNYMQQAEYESSKVRVVDKVGEVRARIKNKIFQNYYRQATSLAKILFLHLYISVSREVTRRLAVTQAKKKHLFVYLKYAWTGSRQFNCLFHPIVHNNGVATLDDAPLTAKAIRNLNQIRVELDIYPVRCGLLESVGENITEPYIFSPVEPRTVWYLGQKILAKLSLYTTKRRRQKKSYIVNADHPYSRDPDRPNYGSTPECMLDYPDPERELPCDPYLPPFVSVTS